MEKRQRHGRHRGHRQTADHRDRRWRETCTDDELAQRTDTRADRGHHTAPVGEQGGLPRIHH